MKDQHRQFFEHIGEKLNFKTTQDWYKLGKEDVYHFGGKYLLSKSYDNSVFKVIDNAREDQLELISVSGNETVVS